MQTAKCSVQNYGLNKFISEGDTTILHFAFRTLHFLTPQGEYYENLLYERCGQ